MIHKKKCETFNNCKINQIENATNNEIKLAILKTAARLKKQDLVKQKKKTLTSNYQKFLVNYNKKFYVRSVKI